MALSWFVAKLTMPSTSSSRLFEPIALGKLSLSHRVVLAPMSRFRANVDHVQGNLGVEYYSQRASMPGTLLISEATIIAPQAGGKPHLPHITSEAQIQGWKKVSEIAFAYRHHHRSDSYIRLQTLSTPKGHSFFFKWVP